MKKEFCKNCSRFIAYYMQFSDSYARLNHGFCSKHQAAKKQYENCENFLSCEQKEKSREERRLNSLDRALNSINEIAIILKEKKDDNIL